MLALRICASSRSGNTDEKQRTRRCSRFWSCSRLCIYGGLRLMEQRWTFFREVGTRNANVFAKGSGANGREKILNRFIAICWMIGKGNLSQIQVLEQPTQTLMFDAAGKGAATHYPIVDRDCLALHSAEQNGNLTQRAIFIVVADGHQKTVRVVEIREP